MLHLALKLLLSCVIVLGGTGCSHRPHFPDQSLVPAGQASPMDGLWRLASGNTGLVFRIDKGRMFFYERRKPLTSSILPMQATMKEPHIRSAADLSSLPGGVIARDIHGTNDPLIYSCQSLSFNKGLLGVGPGEIKLISSTQLVLKTLPNSETGLGEKIEEIFLRENLDNQTWYEQTFLNSEDQVSKAKSYSEARTELPNQGNEVKPEQVVQALPEKTEPSKVMESSEGNQQGTAEKLEQNRKVLNVPMDKMESDGKLSSSAKEFIEKAVRNARAANGYVEINCPPNAPESIVKAIVKIGVETYIDDNRGDYELVIINP